MEDGRRHFSSDIAMRQLYLHYFVSLAATTREKIEGFKTEQNVKCDSCDQKLCESRHFCRRKSSR